MFRFVQNWNSSVIPIDQLALSFLKGCGGALEMKMRVYLMTTLSRVNTYKALPWLSKGHSKQLSGGSHRSPLSGSSANHFWNHWYPCPGLCVHLVLCGIPWKCAATPDSWKHHWISHGRTFHSLWKCVRVWCRSFPKGDRKSMHIK